VSKVPAAIFQVLKKMAHDLRKDADSSLKDEKNWHVAASTRGAVDGKANARVRMKVCEPAWNRRFCFVRLA
jgi:hypothetical protein